MTTPRPKKRKSKSKPKAKRAVARKKKPSPKVKSKKAAKSKKRTLAKPTKRRTTRSPGTRSKPGKAKPKPKARKPRKPRTTRVPPKRTLPSEILPPAGFGPISGLDPNAAFLVIQSRLDRAAELGRVRVHPYADGTIDGEILAKLPRGQSASDVLMTLEETIGREALEGFWISIGVRYTIKEDEEVYRRFKGYNDVNTHYQRATETNISEVFVIGRHEIAEGMADKYGRKADSVYVRLHWNPDDVKPPQRETR